MKTALVLGCSGLIGSHMVNRLKSEGYWVRGVDIRDPEFHRDQSDEFVRVDLRDWVNVNSVIRLYHDDNTLLPFSIHRPAFADMVPFDEVYQFAADMGGAAYIFTGEHDADVMHNSAIINIHVAEAAKETKVGKLFYSSSACIYPKEIQQVTEHPGLRESDAWPANPDSDYGVEKIFSERLYLAYARNYGLNVRIARFHNIFGPNSPFDGVRAKAPAAMCRKAIELVRAQRICEEGRGFTFPKDKPLPNALEVWGTGNQTRSFLYIDDCIDAVRLLVESDFKEPINIGSEEMVTINQLAEMAIELSGKKLVINNIEGPVGVMGRNSNNELARRVLNGWTPTYTLKEGMSRTFEWINQQINGI